MIVKRLESLKTNWSLLFPDTLPSSECLKLFPDRLSPVGRVGGVSGKMSEAVS